MSVFALQTWFSEMDTANLLAVQEDKCGMELLVSVRLELIGMAVSAYFVSMVKSGIPELGLANVRRTIDGTETFVRNFLSVLVGECITLTTSNAFARKENSGTVLSV